MMHNEIEPIPADEARQILEAAIVERLGEDWQSDDSAWVRVTGHDYMARLTNGKINVDFYVDLLGDLTIEEKPITTAQNSGWLIAWMFLLLSLAIVLLFAQAVGWL